MRIFEDVIDFFKITKTTINDEIKVREQFLETKHPIILENWNRSILLWIEALQQAFSCVDNKFSAATFFTNNSDEFYHLFPLIVVINSDSTFDCDGDCTRLFHLRHNTSYKVWVFH